MGDNLVRKGDSNPKSVKWDAKDRAKRADRLLNIDLPAPPGDIIDELLAQAEQLQEAREYLGPRIRENREELRDKESALGLDRT